MTPKVYIAARFHRLDEMAERADTLKRCGFEITSRWVYGGEEGLSREQIALLDLADVDRADIVLSFSEPRGSTNVGGGRHTEFGYGLARGKRMVLIGEREIVFHHSPAVEVYPTMELWVQHWGTQSMEDVA